MAAAISTVMSTTPNRNLNPYGMKNPGRANVSCCVGAAAKRKLPVLLFDVMDTIVRDPFYEDVPAFFGMPMKQLLECKHPTAWIEFEEGLIDEVPMMRLRSTQTPSKSEFTYLVSFQLFQMLPLYELGDMSGSGLGIIAQEELARKFFKDGRDFDLEGLKECMKSGYSYLDGMQQLLHALRDNDYEIHAFTNYPIWYEMIEEKLKLSAYLLWTFCSCKIGKRKPDPEFYLKVALHLGVEPSDCIFIDDRLKNVDSARQIGMVGLRFVNSKSLREDLSRLGVDISLHRNDACNI